MTTTVVATADIKVNESAFLRGFAQTIEKRLDKIAELGKTTIQRSLRQSNNRGLDPAPAGSPPRRGNSGLIGSMMWDAPRPFFRRIGSSAVHSRIQELGGIVTGRNMPIPVSEQAKRFRTMGGRARDFPGKLYPIRASNGKLLLIQKKRSGKNVGANAGRSRGGQNWTIHYVLSNRAVLPERPYLRPLLRNSYFLTRVKNIMAKG